jgi:soluble lytic murein transglycosylase
VAGPLGLAHEDAKLTSPPYNIQVAGRFLHDLVARFKDQVPLAVAAYNCGPEAIARWLTRSPGMELDVFVERIPYRETRDYAGRVMGNLARYAYLAKGESAVPKVNLELPK